MTERPISADVPEPEPGESITAYRARVSEHVGAALDATLAHLAEAGQQPPDWLAAIAILRARERPISAVIEQSVCAACGYPVSYADEGGCVGTLPNAYHMRATCLLEAYRREGAQRELLSEAAEEAIRALEALPRRPSAARLLDVRVGLRAALNAVRRPRSTLDNRRL